METLGEPCLSPTFLGLLTYSKPHKVGNPIKAKLCWDSLYIALKD